MTDTAVQRKYVLTKVKPGDYLLPSNDAERIWRIMRYTEGPSSGLDWPRDREVWGLWYWDVALTGSGVDIDAWDLWGFYDGLYDTRSEAINAAMRTKT